MAETKKEPKKIKRKLLDKYRLVILNEDTFEERLSFKLTRLNVFVLVSLSSIFLVIFTLMLIAFTSLKEYIPGYSSTHLKKKATRLVYETDSLKKQLVVLQDYTKAIRPVLTGDVKPEKMRVIKKTIAKADIDENKLGASRNNKML